jgi:hypothetical protein
VAKRAFRYGPVSSATFLHQPLLEQDADVFQRRRARHRMARIREAVIEVAALSISTDATRSPTSTPPSGT